MKELVMYGNKVVEEKIESYLSSKMNYSELTDKEKIVVINKLQRACKSCGLAYTTTYASIPSVLREDSIFLFIGRNPNKTEAMNNKLFPEGTNQGNTFRKYLEYLGIQQSECSIVNICCCYKNKNIPPDQHEINKCIAFKKFEMQVLKNIKAIFPMGQDALKWCYGIDHPGAMQCNGDMYWSKLRDKPVAVFPILHPSHIILDRELAPEMQKHLRALAPVIERVRKGDLEAFLAYDKDQFKEN